VNDVDKASASVVSSVAELLTVPAKVNWDPPVNVTSVVRPTLSLYVWLPVEVISALITVVPLALVVKVVNGVLPPISADKVVVPVVFNVNEYPPLVAPANVIAPAVLPSIIVFAARVIAVSPSPIEIAFPSVSMVPANVTPLGAVAVIPPVKVELSVFSSPRVKAPVLLNVTALVITFAAPFNSKA